MKVFTSIPIRKETSLADSNITKRALAAALRELMNEIPFEKISIAQICEKCEMNRKSFYYHFKDKYDLVNWIFDTEFIAVANQNPQDTGWAFLSDLCHYLYDNRAFYRKALKISGQNSFSDHFREMLVPIVAQHIQYVISVESSDVSTRLDPVVTQQFYVSFITDGIICAIERWLQDQNCISADDFILLTHSCISKMAKKVCLELNTQ